MEKNDKQQAMPSRTPPFPPTVETNKRKHDDEPLEDSDSGLPRSPKRLLREPLIREEIFAEIEWLDASTNSHGDPDVVVLDREEIVGQLESGASVLALESTETWRSHCRASFCLPRELRGRPNIESGYRLNLKDISLTVSDDN
jgi:hypothetical protein